MGSLGRNCELRRVSNGAADAWALLSVLRPPTLVTGAAGGRSRVLRPLAARAAAALPLTAISASPVRRPWLRYRQRDSCGALGRYGNGRCAERPLSSMCRKHQLSIKTTAAVPPPVVNVPPPVVNVNAIQIEVSRSDTAKAVADMTAKAHLAKAANPAPAPKRPIVAAPPQRRSRTTVWIKAAAVIVVAIGAAEGARRLGLHWPQPAAREEQPVHATPVVASATAAERGATPPHSRSEAKTVAENRASGIAPSRAAALPKPTTAAGRRRAVRQEGSSAQHVAPVVAPAPAPETPAPVPTKPRALVAGSPAPPTGRFFERNDVDEPPQIATRVEPQLPANLPARPHNDVVVVRVLVSSTGHPFRVSLLRGSRLGRSSDEAVVAAVTRWTYSPAKKRGESVNCWYNIGVPLGKAN